MAIRGEGEGKGRGDTIGPISSILLLEGRERGKGWGRRRRREMRKSVG